jgi:HSP20 family protein
MDRLFRSSWPMVAPDEEATASYPVDVTETDGKVLVDAEMPGFQRDDIDISLQDGVLNISAERKAEEPEGTRHLTERRFTRVERAFTLPANVDEEGVDATLQDGVLHIELPKAQESKGRKIEVK